MNRELRAILDGVESGARCLNGLWQEPEHRRGIVTPVTETLIGGAQAVRFRRPFLALALLGVALAAALTGVAWVVLGNDAASSGPRAGVPTLVSKTELRRFAASVDHPVYWAGARRGFRYELTTTTLGRVFVRYLPAGAAAGDPRPDFLTVGTYPGAHSFGDLKRAARHADAVRLGLADGGLVVFAATGSRSAYLGYPGGKYQVEVYAPSSDTAWRLVLDGAVGPIR